MFRPRSQRGAYCRGMPTHYTFLWLNDDGDVAAVDSMACVSDGDALRAARSLFRDDDVSQQWRNCRHIEAYAGTRFVEQVKRDAVQNSRPRLALTPLPA